MIIRKLYINVCIYTCRPECALVYVCFCLCVCIYIYNFYLYIILDYWIGGLEEGDLILDVNGESMEGITYDR